MATLDPKILRKYLPANLVERVVGRSGPLSLEERLQTVGYLYDLLTAISMYVPEHVFREAESLSESERFLEPHYLDGTFLLADISGFTARTEAMGGRGRVGAEELTRQINHLFDLLLEIVSTHYGSVLKFGGDAILAYFPRILGESHTRYALVAAFRMQRAMRDFGLLERNRSRLEIQIGLATGRIFAGQVGDPKERAEYFVSGEPLRRVAAAEEVAGRGEVFVDQETLESVREVVTLGRREGAFQQLLNVEPVAERSILSTIRSVEDPSTMSGVEKNVASLVRALERLRVFLPGPIFRRLCDSPDRINLEPEHRQVTTLFLQFQGVDSLLAQSGEDLDSVHSALTDFFHDVYKIVSAKGGVISRIAPAARGDNLLILFGAPSSTDHDALRAVECASEICRHFDPATGRARSPFGVRMGINTGFAFCANVGSTLRKEYTVMGDSVNLAVRLMELAEVQTARIGETTAELSGCARQLAELPFTQVKGKSEPVRSFQVEAQSRVRPPQASTTTIRAKEKLIGRRQEIETVRRACQSALEGHGRVLFILGDIGAGKSFLLAGARKAAARFQMEAVSIGTRSFDVSSPIRPWIELLLALLGIEPTEDAEDLAHQVDLALQEKFPEHVPWDALISSFLGVERPEGQWTYERMTPRERSDQFVRLLTSMLAKISREHPLALLLDNADRLDAASLNVLHHVVEKVVSMRVVLILTARDSRPFEMFFELEHIEPVRLGPLDLKASRRLLGHHLSVVEIPDAALHWIHRRCSANPLLMGEMVSGLVEQGYLQVDKERSTARVVRPLVEAKVADQIHAYFIRKLDQVSFACRQALTLATVQADPFRTEDLEHLHRRIESGEFGGPAVLAEAMEHSILIEIAPELYSFQHSVLKEVLYESIAFRTRRKLHREMGLLLERRLEFSLKQRVDLLAFHFERSDDHERAIRYLHLAGQRAALQFANRDAAGYFRRALTRIVESGIEADRQLGLLIALAEVLELEGELEEAIEVLDRYQRLGQSALARGESILGRLHTRTGEYQTANRFLQSALEVYNDQDDPIGIGRARQRQGELALAEGEVEAATIHLRAAYEALQTGGDFAGQAQCLISLSRASKALSEPAKTVRYLRRALRIYKKTHSQIGRAICLKELGLAYLEIEKLSRAAPCLAEASLIAEEMGQDPLAAEVSEAMGRLSYWQAEYELAEASFDNALRIARQLQNTKVQSRLQLCKGQVALRLGDWASASASVERTLPSSDIQAQIGRAILAGCIDYEQGDYKSAEARHREAMERASEHDLDLMASLAHISLGYDLFALNQFLEAQQAWHVALRGARHLRSHRLHCEALFALGELYVALEHWSGAQILLETGREEIARSPYPDLRWRIESTWTRAQAERWTSQDRLLQIEQLGAWIKDAEAAGSPDLLFVLREALLTLWVAGRHVEEWTEPLFDLKQIPVRSPIQIVRRGVLESKILAFSGQRERGLTIARESLVRAEEAGSEWLMAHALSQVATLDRSVKPQYQTLREHLNLQAQNLRDLKSDLLHSSVSSSMS